MVTSSTIIFFATLAFIIGIMLTLLFQAVKHHKDADKVDDSVRSFRLLKEMKERSEK